MANETGDQYQLGEALGNAQRLARSLSLALRSASFVDELDAQATRGAAGELDGAISKAVAVFEQQDNDDDNSVVGRIAYAAGILSCWMWRTWAEEDLFRNQSDYEAFRTLIEEMQDRVMSAIAILERQDIGGDEKEGAVQFEPGQS